MKEKLTILSVSFCLVLAIAFLIFNYQTGMTSFAVYNESSENGNQTTNVSENIITKKHASLAIEEAESIISEMQEHNFSTLYMDDTLLEAKRVFEQAKYAEILRNVNSSEAKKQEARQGLRLVDWKEITYEDVLVYTDEIKQRREKAFLIVDEITVAENKVTDKISEETNQILEDAKLAFQEDRYQDTENLLEEFRNALEQETAKLSTLSGIKKGAKNFFQRYWIYVIIVLILLSVIGYFAYRKFEKKLIKNKIRKMKVEKEVLMRLMKKAQENRFKKNIISGLVYKIRMQKYQEREQEIKQELPVLEARLIKLRKKKTNEIVDKKDEGKKEFVFAEKNQKRKKPF